MTFRAQSPGAPIQTSLGHQCSWRQAYSLVPGFPALEVVLGAQGPAAQPATLPLLYSRFVTSDPKARQSPYPLPNYAAPPVLCTLGPHTTQKPEEEKKSNQWSDVVVPTPYAPSSESRDPPATESIPD